MIRVLNAIANAGMRLLGVEPRDELATAHTAEELARLLAESRARRHPRARPPTTSWPGRFDFGGRDLRSVLVPRERVVALDRPATVAEAEPLVVEQRGVPAAGPRATTASGRSASSTPRTCSRSRPTPAGARSRWPASGGSSCSTSRCRLDHALVEIRRARTHVAAVVDDERRFVGLATLEDVLESVVGDIIDESD